MTPKDGSELRASPLLSLPYDVRVQIYRHLFPIYPQIHIMADKQGLPLVPMLSRGELSLSVLVTCSQLYQEAAGHLYNNFIFNVVGLTRDCITNYQPVQRAVEKHARTPVRTDVLDNGVLSSTACISIYASGGFVEGMARRRQRGIPRDLQEVKQEMEAQHSSEQSTFRLLRLRLAMAYEGVQCPLNRLFGPPMSDSRSIPVALPAILGLLLAICVLWLIDARTGRDSTG